MLGSIPDLDWDFLFSHASSEYGHFFLISGCLDLAAKLDFNRDIAPIIDFLTDIGVTIDNIGK